MTSFKIIVFFALTLIIGYISRASLRSPRSHGFARFFAWELILAQALLVLQRWFSNPASWYQVLSWLLLSASLLPLVLGVQMLRKRGGVARGGREDQALIGFEKTTTLVRTGIYKYIRHPLYSSLLLVSWGLFFKLPSVIGAGLAILATGLLVVTARADERECLAYFGEEYREYMRHTRRFIPFLL